MIGRTNSPFAPVDPVLARGHARGGDHRAAGRRVEPEVVPHVRDRVRALVRAALATGTPLFGSCWGLQVITAAAGMNSFQWPMTYPKGVRMMDTEFHKRPVGPLAPPGTYHATLTVGEWSMTQPFDLLKDPRVSTSDADLTEQFDLLIRIRDTLSDIATGVNRIRSLRRQLDDWVSRLDDDDGRVVQGAVPNSRSSPRIHKRPGYISALNCRLNKSIVLIGEEIRVGLRSDCHTR